MTFIPDLPMLPGYPFHVDPKSVAPTDMSERMIQRHMLVMVRRLFPLCKIGHVPNGGKRNKLEAAHLKADGVLPGWPDLIITWGGRGVAFAEVKDRDGDMSKEQKDLLTDLSGQGHFCGVFRHDRTLHDFLKFAGAPFQPRHQHQFLPPG